MRILREPDSLAHQFVDEARIVLVRSQGWDLPSDRNVLINHRHSGSDRITIAAVTPFTFDPRLFQP